MLSPQLTATPNEPPTYSTGLAETFSWVPIQGAGRPLYARATYLANASDINISLSAGDLNVNLADVESLVTSINQKVTTTNSLLSAQLGQGGFIAIQGGETATGTFTTIQVISACKISSLNVSNNSTVGPLTALELPTNFSFNGPITSITLQYGAVIAYKL